MAATIVTEAGLHGATAQPHLPGHYLSWGAIVAGALCAAAISLVLFTFGSAIGLKDAEVKARAAADKASKAPVIAAFLAAATLAIGCAAACAGAVMGGRHRDEQTEIRLFGTKDFW